MNLYVAVELFRTPRTSANEPDNGSIYLDHVRERLADEYLRYARLLARAESLTRTTLALLAALLAAATYFTKTTHQGGALHVVTAISGIFAIAFGLISISISTVVQIRSATLSVTSIETLRHMASPNGFCDDVSTARFNSICRSRESIEALRPVIHRRSRQLDSALGFNLALVASSVCAVAAELIA